jgi:hypothetical protein
MPAVGEGYRRYGWIGIPLIYAVGAVIFGVLSATAWAARGRREGMAMTAWLQLNAGAPMGLTLVSAAYMVASTVPRYIAMFMVLHVVQDFARKLVGRPELISSTPAPAPSTK